MSNDKDKDSNEKFKQLIANWNTTKKKISQIRQVLKKVEDKELEQRTAILTYMNRKPELKEPVFRISDGNQISYGERRYTQPVSKALIEERLIKYFDGDSTKAAKLTKWIYDGRKISYTPTLKIKTSYNKE